MTFRASEVLVARLDQLAEATGSSRSAAIKRAILEASTPANAQPIPDEHEVLVLLSEAARGGNVTAMRELLAYHREREQVREPDCRRPVGRAPRAALARRGVFQASRPRPAVVHLRE